MKIDGWKIALFILITIDSITTAFYFKAESNPMILRIMEIFNFNLVEAMILRIFYCIPLILLLNKKWTKITFYSYIGVYIYFYYINRLL
jgi:hypothetical protein